MGRVNQQKAHKTSRVLFPCVHGLATGQFVTINCFPAPEMKSSFKVVNGADEEIARRVIGASRYNEIDSRVGIGVIAQFSNPYFFGESYGLALAVADKLARFDITRIWSEIYATGKIPADGCGKVEEIEGFDEKLDLLIQKAESGSLFLYPLNNYVKTDHIQQQMQALTGKGIECIPIASINDLDGVVWTVTESKTKPLKASDFNRVFDFIPLKGWQLAFRIAIIGVCILWGYHLVTSVANEPKSTPTISITEIQPNDVATSKPPAFSHQVVKQKEVVIDLMNQPPPAQAAETGKGKQGIKKLDNSAVLESVQVDSSVY